jgi:hypothetical protein
MGLTNRQPGHVSQSTKSARGKNPCQRLRRCEIAGFESNVPATRYAPESSIRGDTQMAPALSSGGCVGGVGYE